MNFKDFLLESVIEESDDFGIEAKKNKFVVSKGKVYKIKDCSETSATLVNGSDTMTVALKKGRFPNSFEFSMAGETANESKNKSKGKVVTEAVNSVSFTLSFSSSNASMVDDHESEVASILRDVAKKISNGSTHGAVMDSNGNKIGKFSYEVDEDDDMDGQEFEPEDDQGIYDESKCAKGCAKCGAKMKADEDGRCPECGAKMITEKRNDFKVTFTDGNTLVTGLNGTLEDAKEYYKKGSTFNLGNGEKDKLVKVKKVEQL
jgi:DNA-directed RNA polymerase subunit RPC12/RpoP